MLDSLRTDSHYYDSDWDSHDHDHDDVNTDLICVLCNEPIITPDEQTNYLCQDKFHIDCIKDYLSKNLDNCPVCNNKLLTTPEYIYPKATNISTLSNNIIVANGLISYSKLKSTFEDTNNAIFQINQTFMVQTYTKTDIEHQICCDNIVQVNNLDQLYQKQKEVNNFVAKGHTYILNQIQITKI